MGRVTSTPPIISLLILWRQINIEMLHDRIEPALYLPFGPRPPSKFVPARNNQLIHKIVALIDFRSTTFINALRAPEPVKAIIVPFVPAVPASAEPTNAVIAIPRETPHCKAFSTGFFNHPDLSATAPKVLPHSLH